MADLDVEALEAQLKDLKDKKAEARERLDAARGGRGRGRGLPGAGRGSRELHRPGVFSRLGSGTFAGPAGDGLRSAAGAHRDGPGSRASVFDRLYDRGRPRSAPAAAETDRDRERERDRDRDRDSTKAAAAAPGSGSSRPPIASRLSSRVVAPAAAEDRENRSEQRNGVLARLSSGDPQDKQQQEDDNAEEQQQQQQPGGSRKRLLSAVLINGQARSLSASLDDAAAVEATAAIEPPLKRPLLQTDEGTKRRAKRMLGVLLQGTLKKAKDEVTAFSASEKAQRRQELERRAAERAEAEDAKRRDEEAAARQREREQQLNALLDLNLQSDIKALELQVAKRIHRKQKLLGFCVTAAQPPLYWLPREASQESKAALDAAAASFEEWKAQQLQQLEADKQEMTERAAAKREAAAQRAAARERPQEEQQQEEGEQEGAAGEAANGEQQGDEEEAEQGGPGDEEMQAADEAVAEGMDADGEEQEAAEDEVAEQEEQQPQQEEEDSEDAVGASMRARRRQLGSEEEEERLLSSEDEDE